MHEHVAIIDDEIVWYGSMNLLSRAKIDDNLIRVKSKDAAQELLEMTFGYAVVGCSRGMLNWMSYSDLRNSYML